MLQMSESLACWPLQETKPGPPTASDDRGQRSRSTPGELELAGRRKPLLCSCRNEVGMHFPVAAPTCPEVLKETSKRRWCSSESRTLIWYRLTRIPRRNTYHDVSSNSQQVQRRHLEQVQQWYLIYASRSSREGVANACIKSTMCPKTNRL